MGKLKYILSDRSPSEKATYCMLPTICHSENGKTMESLERSLVAGAGGGERHG